MAINDKPCGQCDYFDIILRGKKTTKHGWCAKKSVYPAKAGPGQVFPAGVKRAKEGELPVPVIVKAQEVVTNCPHFKEKKSKQTKRDLVKKLQEKDGKVILQ